MGTLCSESMIARDYHIEQRQKKWKRTEEEEEKEEEDEQRPNGTHDRKNHAGSRLFRDTHA